MLVELVSTSSCTVHTRVILTPAVQWRDGWRMRLRGDLPEDIRHVVHCARDMYSTARSATLVHKFVSVWPC